MNATRHLTSDEIVERVFPSDDRPAAVPEHLVTCAACQERVATLHDAWLLDRGAVSGIVDDLPAAFWEEQVAATMETVRAGVSEEAPVAEVRVFPARVRGILRHPMIALSSLAAALFLVGGLSLLRPGSTVPAAQTAAIDNKERSPAIVNDASDDELLVSIDRTLEDSSLAGLIVEDAL
jgi:hypothetical protein